MAEQEQLLATLEAERRRLEVILRQMPAMVVVFGADGRIVQANDQYLAAIGLSADEIVGRDIGDLPFQAVDEAGQVVPTSDLPSKRALRGQDVTAEIASGGRPANAGFRSRPRRFVVRAARSTAPC